MALVDFNVEWAQDTKRMIDAEGGVSEVIHADVTDEDSCRNAVAKTVELFGALHILVNIGRLALDMRLSEASAILMEDLQSASEAPWEMPPPSIWPPGSETSGSTSPACC